MHAACLALLLAPNAPADLPKMKFNEVKEVAPGVFFRYSSISATDKTVPFGGSNHTWVVFKDYVVVVDANFPKEAGDVIAAIKKTTKKPIRYVLDTHHHGDHAYGNAVWKDAGATIVSSAKTARLLRTSGPKEFADAGKGPAGRKDVAASRLVVPDLVFEEKLVLDDGTQRVEFLQLGHSHTIGDVVAYLPKHKVLCTGDACVNGAYNFMGHSDSGSWVRCLERMQQLDVKLVCPGHGPLAGKDLLERQKRYFVDLRRAVRQGLDDGLAVEDVVKTFRPPWYKAWTGVDPSPDNVRHVWGEFTGRAAPWEFAEEFGIYAGPSPTKDSPGWTKPRKVVVPAGLLPGQLRELKGVAPEVLFVPARDPEEAAKLAADADAVLGFATAEVAKAGKKLRWAQAGPAGVTKELRQAAGAKVVLTDLRRLEAPDVAEQTFALLLRLARGGKERTELRGKTMLLVGLGSSGARIARSAAAFGMRVRALDDRPAATLPEGVLSLEKLGALGERLPQADVVVLALPLGEKTRGLIGAKQLEAMKKSAFLVNAAHTPLVDLAALEQALRKGRIAGAGLDTTDVGTLPAGHGLRRSAAVVLTAHAGGSSPQTRERQWRLYRENVRRFAAGEALLCVVEPGPKE